MRLGLLVYPLFALAVAASRGGVVSKFVEAKALSPETARRPESLCIRDIQAVRAAAKRGVLVAVANGRYYVDERRYRRQRRTVNAALIAGAVVLGGLTVLAFWP
jgi:hypothetical protein